MSRRWHITLVLLLWPAATLAQNPDLVEQLLADEEQVAELVELPMGDPTQPPDWGRTDADNAVDPSAGFQELVLQEVLIAPKRRVAVINNQTVTVGGFVDGAVVIEIDMYEVQMRRDGETITLSLSGIPVKEAAQDLHERKQ